MGKVSTGGLASGWPILFSCAPTKADLHFRQCIRSESLRQDFMRPQLRMRVFGFHSWVEEVQFNDGRSTSNAVGDGLGQFDNLEIRNDYKGTLWQSMQASISERAWKRQTYGCIFLERWAKPGTSISRNSSSQSRRVRKAIASRSRVRTERDHRRELREASAIQFDDIRFSSVAGSN